MPRAYVLLNVNPGSEDEVLRGIRNIEGVEEAQICYGVYDLMMKIKADSLEKLRELVTHRVRAIKNVRSTLTLILIEE
jgi:DNA-binding Lrp family transcriptional regulator